MDFSSARLMKQERLLGRKAMREIRKKRIAVAGCGRNGSAFAIFSAYAGFSHFFLIDFDLIRPHNLNATLGFFKEDIGRKKAEVLAERLKSLDPSVEAEPFVLRVEEADCALENADIIVDALDSIPSKLFLNEKTSEFHKRGEEKTLLSLGSGSFVKQNRILQLGAQAVLFEKGGACLLCGPLDEEEKTNLSDTAFIVLNALSAVLGLQLLIYSLCSQPYIVKPDFLLYDCLSQTLISLKRKPRASCPYCGTPSQALKASKTN